MTRQINYEPLPASDLLDHSEPRESATTMNEPEPKTEPWTLESLSVNYSGELWTIRCGGACQPEYTITEHSLEKAIVELVRAVTESAIHDEALEWSNASDQATTKK